MNDYEYDDDITDGSDEPLTQAEMEIMSAMRRNEFLPEQLRAMLAISDRDIENNPELSDDHELQMGRARLIERIYVVELATLELEEQWAMPATHER
jgi:hypothetical protein